MTVFGQMGVIFDLKSEIYILLVVFWSLDGVDGPLDSPPSFHSFVRAHFPENPRIRIFWFFVLKNEKKMSKKVTFSLFHRKFENGPFLAKNSPKSAFLAQNTQKWGFLAFVSKTAHWNFLIFCRKPSLCSPKNIAAFVFQGNLKNGPFWPILSQIWPKFG